MQVQGQRSKEVGYACDFYTEETTYQNYNEIRFKPTEFKEYLLSQEVGFTSCEVIGTPVNKSKGFRRPMMMFTKLQTISRPVSRRPSTEKPPVTVTSSVTSSIPAIPHQPLTQPRAGSSTPKTAGVGDKMKPEAKEVPPVDILAGADPKPVKVKEEPPVGIPAAADPSPVAKLKVSSSETADIGQEVRSRVIQEPKEEPILEEGGKAEVMEATEMEPKDIPAEVEEGGAATTVKSEDTTKDAVAETTQKSKPEEIREKGDTMASSVSSSSRTPELETKKGEQEGLGSERDCRSST
ncbi:titin-like [Lytechinus pictus]|uniref:titin-like n=1 Tax=Lytechinus pictus TaxID=7653 RepID=UPI0030BA1516